MAAISQEAGPEWAYISLYSRNKAFEFDFDSLYIRLEREGDSPHVILDSIQMLSVVQGMYVPSDVTRFSFDTLTEWKGADPDRFDLFFEAYDDAKPGVAIAGPSSFRRLLLAIRHLGLPTPGVATARTDFPPVLRFFVRPKHDLQAYQASSRNVHRQLGQRTFPPGSRDTPMRHEDTPPAEDTPMGYGDTPPAEETRAIRDPSPSPEDISMRYGDSSSPIQEVATKLGGSLLESPVAEATRTSFLPDSEEPEPELTFEERLERPLDYGLNRDPDDVHDITAHNLYSDIASLPRNKRDPQNKDDEYRPPYSSVSLFPQQRYVTGWVYSDRNRIVHYLSDKVGLGKTFAAIELLLRTTLILSNKIDIENERAKLASLGKRPRHVHRNVENSKWPENDRCGADVLNKWGFVCSCTEESPTYMVAHGGEFNEGYMMVVVPLLVNSQWIAEINRFIRSSVRLPHNRKPFKIVNIHEGTNYGENLKNFVYEQQDHLGLGTIVVVPTTSTVKATWIELGNLQKKLKSQPSIIVWDEIHEMKVKDNLPVQFIKRLIDRADYPVHVLALSGSPMTVGPADFDVIESIATFPESKSFPGWYSQQLYDNYVQRLRQARANLDAAAKTVNGLDIIARGHSGELQGQERAEAHDAVMLYDQRLREYATELPMLQRKGGSRFLGYFIPKDQSASQRAQLVNFDTRMNNAQRAVANEYKEYLRIRYRHKVKYWSQKPEATRGPRPKMKEILFGLEAKVKIPDSSQVTVSLIGFAPGLATQVLKRTENQFRAAEANDIFRGSTISNQREKARQSRYYDAAPTAFTIDDPQTGEQYLHPKIDFICQLIRTMLEDTEEHTKGGRKLGVLRKKMVICVPHAWQGYILTCFLMQYFPLSGFTFIGARNQGRERDELLAPFQRPTDVKSPEDGRTRDPIVLISTFNIIGTGLNLIRANYSVATSPLGSVTQETQFFGRINRIGQYATTHNYILLDNGNPVDVTTFHRNRRRTALTVPADEFGSGLQYLLDGIDEEDNRPPDIEYDSGAGDSDAE